jgi:cell division protease FtsH
MVTRYGMSDKYGMMALETVKNAYLGGDASLTCSDKTAADIDKEVHRIINEAHDKARQIITDNLDKMHEATNFLLEKETITGEEFMKILNDASTKSVGSINNATKGS